MFPTSFRPGPVAVAIALALGSVATQAQQAGTALATTPVEIRIQAQPLAQALDTLARQTRLELMVQPALVAGKTAPAVAGRLSPREALDRLLAGSGLAAEINGSAVVVQRATPPAPATPPGDAATLAPVTVTADADRATTELTGSYTARALTIGKMEQSIRETPQSVTVVTRQQMDDQNLVSIEAVVAQTTGTSKSQRNFGSHTYMLRGYQIPDSNYLIDGVSGTALSPTGWVPTDTAVFDRVEILRGAGAVVVGAGDPSGVINQVRKRPRAERHLDVALSAGSWNNYRTEIDAGAPLNAEGTLRGRVVAAYQDRDYFYDVTHSKEPLFYGVLEADLSPATRATFGLRHQQVDISGYTIFDLPRFSDGTHLDVARSTSFAQNWNRHEASVNEVFGELEHRHDNGWNTKFTISRNLTDAVQKLAAARGAVNPVTLAGTTLRTVYFSDRQMQSSGFDVNTNGTFEAFGATHRAMFGADWSDSTTLVQSTTNTLSIPVDIYNFNHALLAEPATPAYANRQTESVKRYSLYASARFELARPLHLVLGGRINWYAYRTLNLVSGAVTNDYSQNGQATPYAGLIYDLNPQWSVYASYANTFVAQSQYSTISGSVLKPAVGSNYEAGLKGELMDGKLNVALAVFDIRKRDVAVQDTANNGLCPGVTTNNCYTNASLLISRGFDVEVAGELARGWQVSAGYTHLQTHYANGASSGSSISADTPEHMLRVSTSYRLPGEWQKWTVGGTLAAQTDSYVVATAINPGRAILDLRAAYQIDKRWTAQLNIGNVADKRYWATTGDTTNGNAFGAPRNFMLTLRGSF